MVDGKTICARCGARLVPAGRFCGECGAAASRDDLGEQRRIGRFVLDSIIGHGGMGVVYRARDTDLERDVALKLIAPTLATDHDFRARFEAEARAAAAVDHANVLPIFDAGEHGGELYLVMRLVEGTDLAAVLARESRLTPTRTGRIVAQIAAALDAAHTRNLVHRDVKPANVLMSHAARGRDHIYLADFGLTQVVDQSIRLTTPGQVVGTANYIAPEHADGRPIDGRVDVYALACVAFECLTGAPPFARETATATLGAHVHDEIPLASSDVPELTSEVDDALAGGLAKEPAHRFASCGALATALGSALGTGTGELPHDPRVASRAHPSRQPAGIRSPDPARAPTAALEQARPTRSAAGGRILTAIFALIAVAGTVAAAIILGPSLLEGEGSRGDPGTTLELLSGAHAVNENLSMLMSRLAHNPGDRAEREGQERQLSTLRAEVRQLLAAARDAAEPAIRPLLVRSLRTQRELIDQYGEVLAADPADAAPLIEAMLRTLDQVEADLRETN